MWFRHFEFGAIDIDGVTYERDLVVDRGKIHGRKKKASKKFRETFGHTPLSAEENIPWKCTCLVIGTGAYGRLPVMDDVKREAKDRRVKLVVLPTAEAIKLLQKRPKKTNAVLHVTGLPIRPARPRPAFGWSMTRAPAARIAPWPHLRIVVSARGIAA